MDDFATRTRAALALAGIEITEDDLAILSVVAQAFGPGMDALDRLDLAEFPLEGALDPATPPR